MNAKEKTRKPTSEEVQHIVSMLIGLYIAEEIKNKLVPEVINGEIAKLQKENTELKEKLNQINNICNERVKLINSIHKKDIKELKEKLKELEGYEALRQGKKVRFEK